MRLAEIFGKRVREVRHELGWTQEQLAFEAGIKRAYLSEIESSKRNPTLDVVEKLAVALGVPPAQLMQ